MNIYQPFTYHIAWTKQDLHYYGVRYADQCNPTDLWTTYFTSSKVVQQLREDLGEPDTVEVRRIFQDSDAAIDWENKVLRRLNVMESDTWVNRNINIAPRWHESHRQSHLESVRGRKYTDQGKQKLAESRKLNWSDDKQQKMISARTEESRRRIAEFQRGRTRSAEHKAKIVEIRKAEWADAEKTAARKKAISDAVKAKWADPEYREKMLARKKSMESSIERFIFDF